jgi:Asp-tRNA(Asn)/Glu-tRNA(Gln) amidotransferase A subunit family amidase
MDVACNTPDFCATVSRHARVARDERQLAADGWSGGALIGVTDIIATETFPTVPFWRSTDGMPLGLQPVGRSDTDRPLIETAQWFHERAAGG